MLHARQLLMVAGAVASLAVSGVSEAKPRHERSAPTPHSGQPGQFDYYALSLSWSPSYCATHKDPNQCGTGRQLGFVLHGLWPQYDKGYPERCSTEPLSAADKARYAPLFPSPTLIAHEWPKHGTCSGLTPAGYFELSAKLKQELAIPASYQAPAQPVRTSHADLIASFRKANPPMQANGVLPFCSNGGRFLSEIHACYDKGGAPASCSAGEVKRSEKSCGQDTFLLRSVR